MTNKKNVFIISKPMVPPWNDSGKNIAKDQVIHAQNYSYRVLTTQDFSFKDSQNIRYERIYPSGGTFQAGLKQNLKVMFAGLQRKDTQIYHYFFAPNSLSSKAGRIQKTLTGVKTVQTFCSRPASYENIHKLIFTDKVITLSKDTRDHLLNAGIPASKVVHIPPGITLPAPITEEEKSSLKRKYHLGNGKLVLFPGDYEFSDAAQRVADAVPGILTAVPDAQVLFACRTKTARSQQQKANIVLQLSQYGQSVRFLDEIDDMPRLVGAADALLLPQDDLYAKMDIPLVLLEAMAHQVPLVVANTGPLYELVEQNAAIGVGISSNELTQATTQILSDSTLSKKIGTAGQALTKNKYNAILMAKSIESLYDELLTN